MKKNRKVDIQSFEPTYVDGWPTESIDDVDDEAFARAIAAGREAESRELIDA